MSHADDQHHQSVLDDLAHDSIVADTVAMKSVQTSAQGFSADGRVVERRDLLLQVRDDLPLDASVEFLECSERLLFELNRPGQVRPLLLQAYTCATPLG